MNNMLELMTGKVTEILSENDDISEVLLDTPHPVKKGINYNKITGKVSAGDCVYLNTTACTLSLGTGGYHFIIANISRTSLSMSVGGHGMKLRYTPIQVKVPFTEEEKKEWKAVYDSKLDLRKTIVFFAELHSMVPPLSACLKYKTGGKIRTAYIMTDHAALPAAFSKSIACLKHKGLIDCVITTGNAFGGDYECVNIYTALQTAAKESDAIIVAMGPGITGTGTKYGFSGLELGFYSDLAVRHEGKCYYVPRISFADSRPRHYGLSHHSLTVLGEIMKEPVNISIHTMTNDRLMTVSGQLEAIGAYSKHIVTFTDGSEVKEAMDYYNLDTVTMGRGINDDPEFFLSIGASAAMAIKSCNGQVIKKVGPA